jgi:hypothetical protein
MWSPGSGRLKTDAGFYDIHIISPTAKVTGRVGGQEVSSNQGYAEHVATDAPPYDLARSFRRARLYKDDLMILWRDIELHPDIGGGNTPWILVTYKDKIVFSSSRARIRYGSKYTDSKSGYVVPKAVQIDAKNGKDSIKLIMKARRTKRKDLLAGQGAFVKAVASAVAEPYQFTATGEYTLEMNIGGTKAQVSNKGHFTMDFVTK